MRTQQSGFTLIELIMVIVILGILAAAALPRFADLQVNARQAKAAAILGAVRSGANIAHASALATNATANQTISLDGISVAMANRYPTASATGIMEAAGLNANNDDLDISQSGNVIDLRVVGANTLNNCRATYTNDGTNAPTFVLDDTGC